MSKCKDCLWWSIAKEACMRKQYEQNIAECFEPLIPEVMEMTTCAVCGSTNVTVRAKLHSDLFTCNECGYEWRT